MRKINNINRRKFLEIIGYCSCGLVINSCSTAPITDRKQLKLLPESTLNAQAAQIYENVIKTISYIKIFIAYFSRFTIASLGFFCSFRPFCILLRDFISLFRTLLGFYWKTLSGLIFVIFAHFGFICAILGLFVQFLPKNHKKVYKGSQKGL